MTPVFFAQALDGIGYVRCILPARAIGAEVLDFDDYCAGKRTPEECWEPFVGRPAIFPLVANWSRLHAMRDYRRITGAAVLRVSSR